MHCVPLPAYPPPRCPVLCRREILSSKSAVMPAKRCQTSSVFYFAPTFYFCGTVIRGKTRLPSRSISVFLTDPSVIIRGHAEIFLHPLPIDTWFVQWENKGRRRANPSRARGDEDGRRIARNFAFTTIIFRIRSGIAKIYGAQRRAPKMFTRIAARKHIKLHDISEHHRKRCAAVAVAAARSSPQFCLFHFVCRTTRLAPSFQTRYHR